LSLEEVGARLKKPRQRILEFENAEAEDRITLQSLRRVAAALDCNLVYALVPRTGSIMELAERRTRQDAARDVLDVEHTMALENQATGNVSKLIDDEAQRRLRKR
jgi:predicted DNA-binding mobile mystery protein A